MGSDLMTGSSVSNSWRLFISAMAVSLPFLFLSLDIYGSFLFTIPFVLLWQIGLRNRPLSCLGIGRPSFFSLAIGLTSGIALGFACGQMLEFLGITGYTLGSSHALEYSLGPINIVLPIGRELGYRLLIESTTLKGTFFYLLFCLLVVGFGEELFWRGFIQARIAAYLPKRAALIITALLFSLVHFYIITITPLAAGLSFLLLIAGAGLIWGYMCLYFGNIWAGTLSHALCAFVIWKYYFFQV
jgi:membrane protease YdiL (CAAX protease family)